MKNRSKVFTHECDLPWRQNAKVACSPHQYIVNLHCVQLKPLQLQENHCCKHNAELSSVFYLLPKNVEKKGVLNWWKGAW